MAACPEVLAPETFNCSGRGVCLNAWMCSCPEGWTGRSDFVYGAPTCAIQIESVRALYGTVACVAFFALLCSSLYLQRVLRGGKSRRPCASSAVLMGVCCFITSLMTFALGCYRAALPEAVIGTDVFATLAHAIGEATYGAQMGIYYHSVIALAFRQAGLARQHADDALFRRLRVFLILHCTFVSLFAAPTLFLLMQIPELFNIMPRVHLFGFATVSMYLSIIYVKILAHVAKSIRQRVGVFAEQGGLQKTLTQMDQLIASATYSAGLLCVVSIVFGVWRGLQIVGFAYLNPVMWLVMLLLMALGLLTLLDSAELVSKHNKRAKAGKLVRDGKSMQVQAMMQQTTLDFGGRNGTTLIGTMDANALQPD